MGKRKLLTSRSVQGIRCRISGFGITIGSRKGRLVVLGEQFGQNKRWKVVCACDCGKIICTLAYELGRRTHSCGCLKNELTAIRSFRHGELTGTGNKSRLYICWNNIVQRCYDENSPAYEWYGARGISLCDEWLNNFGAFKQWALTNGYQDNLTIDRKEPDGNYNPDNCRWITNEENARRARKHIAGWRSQAISQVP